MEIAIDIDEIVQEVVNSSQFSTSVEDAIGNEVDERIGRLAFEDIDDFERRVGEIVTDAIDGITSPAEERDNDLTERVAVLENKVAVLVNSLISITQALIAKELKLNTTL